MKRWVIAVACAVLPVFFACGEVHRPSFVVPETLYAAPGIECNVYFSAVVDSVTPWCYAFEVLGGVGRCENDRWTWTPTAEDSGRCEKLVFHAWSDEGLACVCTAMVHVARSVDDRMRRVTCAILGDSLTNSRYQDQVLKMMHSAGWSNFATVGSRPFLTREASDMQRPGVAAHDGYGGFQPESFLSRYALTAGEIDNLQDEAEREQLRSLGDVVPDVSDEQRVKLKSPLVRIVNGRKTVDVQSWLDRINGGRAPDMVIVELGGNGTFSQRDESIAEYCERHQVAPMRELVKRIRAVAPKAAIAICTVHVGADQAAFGANYGCAYSAVQWRKNCAYITRCWMALVKEFNDAGDGNVHLVPLGNAIDPVRGYPVREVAPFVHSSKKEQMSCNALHPSLEGGKQAGDAIASWILCLIGGHVE